MVFFRNVCLLALQWLFVSICEETTIVTRIFASPIIFFKNIQTLIWVQVKANKPVNLPAGENLKSCHVTNLAMFLETFLWLEVRWQISKLLVQWEMWMTYTYMHLLWMFAWTTHLCWGFFLAQIWWGLKEKSYKTSSFSFSVNVMAFTFLNLYESSGTVFTFFLTLSKVWMFYVTVCAH